MSPIRLARDPQPIWMVGLVADVLRYEGMMVKPWPESDGVKLARATIIERAGVAQRRAAFIHPFTGEDVVEILRALFLADDTLAFRWFLGAPANWRWF